MASRRRRKSQAAKSRSRKTPSRIMAKALLYGGLICFVLLFVGLVYGYNKVRTYLRSDEFRVMLGKRGGSLLEGKGSFSLFRWDGWSVSTDEFSFIGADGVKQFRAAGIDAEVDIGAVWDKTYRLENIRLREIDFQGDFREGVTGTGEIDEWESNSDGFWTDFLPNKFEMTGADVASVSGVARTDEGDWEWSNTSARITPGSGKNVYDLQLNGGSIKSPLPLLKEISLVSLQGRYSGDQFFVLGSEFGALKDATVTAEGDYSMRHGEWTLRGELSGARVEELVAEDWKRRLMGPIGATFEVNGRPGGKVIVTGDLELTDGVLTALPVLDRIAAYTNLMRFRRLALNKASIDFERRGNVLELRNIILASEGLVRLEGEMTIDGQLIRRGDLRLGITPETLGLLPGAETKVFQRGELGLHWTPIKVSGTLDAPQEDLSARLIAAAGERMFEKLPETGQYALKYTGTAISESTKELLSSEGIVLGTGKTILDTANKTIEGIIGVDPGSVIEGGAGAVEKGTGAVGEGVGKLFDLFGRPIKE